MKSKKRELWDRRLLAFVASVLAVVALFSLFAESGASQTAQAASSKPTQEKAIPAPAPAAPALTAADLEAFLDGLVPLQIKQRDIAGVVVVVVQNGQVLFAKGYGYADAEKKTPVSPETTLFRPGSVSKLFTWTAVMQLVEQGKLDLDRDVNAYLDFQLPSTFEKPITLRNILTHTPGFEDVLKDLFCSEVSQIPSLRSYVASRIPRRIYSPGTTVAYSNYGTALAGYIVERVSGQPFSDYVTENIFKPLGMKYSTFVQPLPEPLRAHMSNGYTVASEKPRPFELVPAVPAGALSTSGLDMARFILAHLQEGRSAEGSILRPETVKLMHSRQWGVHETVNGMALGFYEEARNGHRIIGHGGDTVLFHSDLHLIPDAGIGFFISQNSAGRGEGSLRSALWQKFLDRYFPYTPPAAPKMATAVEDARTLSGTYMTSRRNDSTFLRALAALGSVSVTSRGEGIIEVSALKDLNGQTKRWEPIAPLMYRDVNGQDVLVFRRDASGRLEAMLSAIPVFVFQRVPWFQSRPLLLLLFGFALAVFALTLVFWGIGAWLRWHYERKLVLGRRERFVRIAARIACVIIVLFVLGFVLLFQAGQKNVGMFNSSLDPVLRLLQAVGWIGALGMLVILYDAYLCWAGARGWVAKASSALLVLACVAWTWFAAVTNTLSLNLRY